MAIVCRDFFFFFFLFLFVLPLFLFVIVNCCCFLLATVVRYDQEPSQAVSGGVSEGKGGKEEKKFHKPLFC